MLKKLTFLLALLALGITPALAGNFQGFVFEQHNTSINSATGNVCGSATAPATYAVLQVQGGNAYYTYNGTTPSATNGFLLSSGQSLPVYGQGLINALQFIGATTGVTLNAICTQ